MVFPRLWKSVVSLGSYQLDTHALEKLHAKKSVQLICFPRRRRRALDQSFVRSRRVRKSTVFVAHARGHRRRKQTEAGDQRGHHDGAQPQERFRDLLTLAGYAFLRQLALRCARPSQFRASSVVHHQMQQKHHDQDTAERHHDGCSRWRV